MEQSLFRKESMDRIQSPEQLNDYLRVTNPTVWAVLLAVIVLLAGFLVWASFARIDSYIDATAEVRGGVMTMRVTNQSAADNVQPGMKVSAGGTETAVSSVGRDANGLFFAHADTALADGFYSVRIVYKQTQVLKLLFN